MSKNSQRGLCLIVPSYCLQNQHVVSALESFSKAGIGIVQLEESLSVDNDFSFKNREGKVKIDPMVDYPKKVRLVFFTMSQFSREIRPYKCVPFNIFDDSSLQNVRKELNILLKEIEERDKSLKDVRKYT